jgi:crotonobetainyl-CoA:carnitine CoA-transferase CaiB-like acyl-CoA transferase
MAAPLEGIRVVEIASDVAVPACGALLADPGADTLAILTEAGVDDETIALILAAAG